MRFGFLLKRGKPEAREIAAELGRTLRRMGCALVALADDAGALPEAEVVVPERLGASIDALAVLGGDGTFLYGAGLVADQGVPIFGINLGSLGFITPYARSEAVAAIGDAARGRLGIEERIRLAVTLPGSSTTEAGPKSAVNDSVL